MRQIAVIKPKVVVALGAVSAKNLLAINAPMSELRGRWYDFKTCGRSRQRPFMAGRAPGRYLPPCIPAARSAPEGRGMERSADGDESIWGSSLRKKLPNKSALAVSSRATAIL
jgi:hypothetical protein